MLLSCPFTARAALMGDLDPTFGDDGVGVVAIPPVSSFDDLYAVTLQPDGKIVAVGRVDFGNDDVAVIRLHADGTLDDSFSGDGIAITSVGSGNARGSDVIVQADGAIVVTGRAVGASGGTDVLLIRYLDNGTLDGTFGTGGIVLTNVAGGTQSDNGIGIVQQPDGKLVVAGNGFPGGVSQLHVLRYLSNGALDPDFGTGGVVAEPAGAFYASKLTLLPSGKILAVGSCLVGGCLVRYLDDGSLDTTFGPLNDGVSAGGRGRDDLWVQPDGKIVGVGPSGSRGAGLTRWNADGTPDTSFGLDGSVYEDPEGERGFGDQDTYAIAGQSDGKILVNSQTLVPVIDEFGDLVFGRAATAVRFNADGAIDQSFGPFGDGVSMGAVPLTFGDDYLNQGDFNDLVIDTDGRLLGVGLADVRTIGTGFDRMFALARYDLAGCSGVARPTLTVNNLLAPAGNEKLQLAGTVTVPTTPALDPVANGLRIHFTDLAGGTYIDVPIPPGAGWKSSGQPGTHWTYKNKLGLQGLTKVDVKQDKVPGRYKIKVQGKNADFMDLTQGVNGDLLITVTFDVAAMPPTQCAGFQWPGLPLTIRACEENASGKTLKCK